MTNIIAKIGVQPWWIALNAHCWFAYALVVSMGLSHLSWVAPAALIAAAIKEFWFDATYEVPKQTFNDNLEDFGGYTLGVALAVVKLMFVG